MAPGERRSTGGIRLVDARKPDWPARRWAWWPDPHRRASDAETVGQGAVLSKQKAMTADSGLGLAGAAAGERQQGRRLRCNWLDLRPAAARRIGARPADRPGRGGPMTNLMGMRRRAGESRRSKWALAPAMKPRGGCRAQQRSMCSRPPTGRGTWRPAKAKDGQQGHVKFDGHRLKNQHGVAARAGRFVPARPRYGRLPGPARRT